MSTSYYIVDNDFLTIDMLQDSLASSNLVIEGLEALNEYRSTLRQVIDSVYFKKYTIIKMSYDFALSMSGLKAYNDEEILAEINSSNWLQAGEAEGYVGSEKSLYFNGIDQYINYGTLGLLNTLSDMTLLIWIKANPLSNKNVFYIQNSSTAKSTIFLTITSGDRANIILSHDGEWGTGKSSIFTVNLTDGAWHSIAVTYSASTDTLTCFADGLVTTQSVQWSFPMAGLYYSSGSDIRYATAALEGNLDDLALFDIQKSISDINRLHNNGVPMDIRDEAGLVMYSKLGDDMTVNVQHSVIGNDGIVENFDASSLSTDVPS